MEAFSAVDYIDDLIAVGVSENQAKVQARAFGKAIDANIATKKDIEILRSETKTDILLVRKEIEISRSETKTDIELLRSETKKELALMENRLLWKVFGLMAIQTGFLAALKFFV